MTAIVTTTAHDLSTPEGLAAFRDKLIAQAKLDLAIEAYCTKRAQYDPRARFREQARMPLDPTAAALLDAIFDQWSAR